MRPRCDCGHVIETTSRHHHTHLAHVPKFTTEKQNLGCVVKDVINTLRFTESHTLATTEAHRTSNSSSGGQQGGAGKGDPSTPLTVHGKWQDYAFVRREDSEFGARDDGQKGPRLQQTCLRSPEQRDGEAASG